MTREEAIQAYEGPLEPTHKAWDAWRGHLARLLREDRITFDEATSEWDPPTELQGFEEGMKELADMRRGRAYLRRKGRRVEVRREARIEERVNRMRERKP